MVSSQRLEEIRADDASTCRLDLVFDATLPVPTTMSAAVVPSTPRRDTVPLALHARYQDIRRIGAGGMGVVFRARDPRLGRDVALKLLKESDSASWVRFLAEAQAQARVEHDHICRVYEVGEAEGEPFIVMQLVNGEPLASVRRHMSLRQLIELVQKVANAVQAAHARGLVHRDLKPGNILVEAREDGSFRPYVVDFGLAREVERGSEHTLSPSLGTPAYMAPEVAACGSSRVVDPRVDVYGLGATLYDAIAGRPPYVDDHPFRILARLSHEDPPTLRDVAKGVSRELEAIVMKCLERNPARRYASAGALAKDLARFLNGEVPEARRAGLGAALRRKARKHARASALALGFLVLGSGGVHVREQGEAAAQAELAQDIGRLLTDMELFMRTAYQMPPHDIERERAVVRERIRSLEHHVAKVGAASEGTVQYALGKAYLALGEEEQACMHLEQAEAAGYASPELGYALALAQLGTYFRLRSESFVAEEQKNAEAEGLKARYYTPALARLRAAEPARIQHPAYAAALVAYHEGRHEEAVEKAREAFLRAPLLYEAKQLEADALVEIASRHWSSGEHDWWEKMHAGMNAALEAYAAAENIARSDPRVLQAVCGARTRLMYAAFGKEASTRPFFEAGRAACDRLVLVDPSSSRAHAARAALYSLYAFGAARSDAPPGDLPSIADEAIRIAEDAMHLSAKGLIAYGALGTALRARAIVLLDRGEDATSALDRADRLYDEARGIFEHDPTLHDSAAYVYHLRAMDERRRGIDVAPRIESAERALDAVLAVRPRDVMAHDKRAQIYLERAEQELDRGQSPMKWLEASLGALSTAKARNPAYGGLTELRARAFLAMTRHALATGGPLRETLERADEELRILREEAPDSVTLAAMTGLVATLRAEEQLGEGADPKEPVARARAALREATVRSPHKLEIAVGAAHVELVAARHAVSQGKATNATFEAVRAPLKTWMTDKLVDPAPLAVVAESYALAAEWHVSQKKDPGEDVRAGLVMVDRALAKNPRDARALASRGRLLLARARATKEASGRREAARSAVEAFEAAVRANPLIERAHGKALGEAQTLR
ncbi:serine/threonine-protein kinase [Polyangium jinanense]|uniref:Serine/threonine protein kinase n=1 Tax=Polyangium jinanense TaxID=2829994 RepID=A0A9X4ATH1_9BACT|nr:serine/threonine-protein kinase [Polyangium jinanense]MDC3955548.1 serine/threonine protein kinase [Polyangium jinanense]MDC3982190.1 serine/threonine protein kinase [Polyangium jinanense]